MKKSLDKLRARVDKLDSKIVDLLNSRAATCTLIGEEKRKVNAPLHDPKREEKVLRKISRLSKGSLSRDAIKRIYRQVIAECLDLQKTR